MEPDIEPSEYIERLEADVRKYRHIATQIITQAAINPFAAIGHWVEHGPCAEALKELEAELEYEERCFANYEKQQMGL